MTQGSPFALAARAQLAAAALIASLSATAATAATTGQDLHKDDLSFNFFNDFSHTVTGFRTADRNGRFGHNWLSTPMQSGHGLTLAFTEPPDHRFEVMTRVVFDDGAVFDNVINYCGMVIVRATGESLAFE